MTIRVYTDESHYAPDAFYHLNDIVRGFWDPKLNLGRGFSPQVAQHFTYAENPADADVFLLPMNWDYYVQHSKQALARDLAKKAQRHGRLIIIYALGDFEPLIDFPNALLLQSGLRQSRRKAHQYAIPSLFSDYVTTFQNSRISYRQKQDKPVIGFCGQGKSRWHRLILWIGRNALQHIRVRLGRADYDPGLLIPHIFLRARILTRLSHSDRVKADFIIRDKYGGGAAPARRGSPPDPKREQIRREFIDNVVSTDYTVCIRGTANYSQRIYETLCLGRIPIFVNTDCVLPYDFAVDWKQYCVWVEPHEIDHSAEKVADFHASLTPGDFSDLQRACRRLWEDRLSTAGFYAHFHEHLAHSATQ